MRKQKNEWNQHIKIIKNDSKNVKKWKKKDVYIMRTEIVNQKATEQLKLESNSYDLKI